MGLLRNQQEEDRRGKSLAILERLLVDPAFLRSKTILFYASFDGEVETFEMMTQAKRLGKQIALPTIFRTEKKLVPILVEDLDDLEEGAYGIRQPRFSADRCLLPEDLDFCLVPGVGFDRSNLRLGRGAGYYDRFLCTLPRAIPTVGLAFRFQILDRLPRQPHDVAVSRVISE